MKQANKDSEELQANIAAAQQNLAVPPGTRVVRVPAEAYIVYPENGAGPGTIHVTHPQAFPSGMFWDAEFRGMYFRTEEREY